MSTPFVSRSDWGARPARSTPARINNEGQTAHYGGGSPWGAGVDRSSPERFAATADHARCATILRGWQAFHMSPGWGGTKNGAADLAYNSAVCPHGYRFEGRGVGRRSAGQGTNAGNSRSCATVYIAGAGDPLTDAAKLAFLDEAARFGVAMRWNHGDWKNTACAGPAIRAWQAAGFPAPTSPTPTTEADMKLLHPHDTPGDSGSIWLLIGDNVGRVRNPTALADIQKLKNVPLERIGKDGWADIKRVANMDSAKVEVDAPSAKAVVDEFNRRLAK